MKVNERLEKDVYTMAIESSCDETACAILKNGREVLSNIVYSQIEVHKMFGGVVPEVASRNHLDKISEVVDSALAETNMTFDDIDNIATTYGPGLVGALLVGVSTAKALAFSAEKELTPVNHIEGHVCANYIAHTDLKPPFICLIVSGGHTHLVHVKDYVNYEILGRTRDDAAGEAFDKVARTLGLGYPGGPIVDRLSKEGNEKAIDFPRAYLEKDSLDFSFSGLKSAVLNYLNNNKQKSIEISEADVCASFQKAVVEVLVNKSMMAIEKHEMKTLVIAGGVAANSKLRGEMELACSKRGIELKYPTLDLCTDNAAMIGASGYYNYVNGIKCGMDLNAVPNLKIGDKRYNR